VYTTEMFETKTVKRCLEQNRVNYIKSQKAKGCVVSLCGPAVRPHIKFLKPLLNTKSELLFAEWDKEVFLNNNMKQTVSNERDPRISIQFGNVWDAVRKRYVHKKGWQHKHIFFDLDFCATAETLLAQGLQKELKTLATSKLPKKSGFFVSLTMCRRNDRDGEYIRFYSRLLEIFFDAGWSIKYSDFVPYRENNKKGTVMVNIFLHVKKDNNKVL
jgi:hypothetical protein